VTRVGCLSRIGCLVVLAGAGAAGWYLYGDRFPAEVAHVATRAAESVRDAVQSPSDRDAGGATGRDVGRTGPATGAERARTVGSARPILWATVEPPTGSLTGPLTPLARRDGTAYLSIGAGDVAKLLSRALSAQLPASATAVQVALDSSRLLVRAVVNVAELAGDGTLARVLGTALSGRDTVQLSGTLEMLAPGVALYRVQSARVKGVTIPGPLVPPVMRAMHRGPRIDGVPDDALAVRLPASVGDLRIANGRVIVYKTVPSP